MQPRLRERGRQPYRATLLKSAKNPHSRGRRRPDATNFSGRGESLSFRSDKAPVPDGITYYALERAPRKFVIHMTNICNACATTHLNGSKIADRIIFTRLQEETDDFDVIPNCQFGFRRGHHPPGAAHHRADKRRLQPTRIHRSDASGRHLQGNGQASPFLPPQEDIKNQTGRIAVHSEDSYSRSAARVSHLTLLFSIYTSDIPATAQVNLAMSASLQDP
ncbi:hypothetical protein Trydic_g7204 [Trypoxylus dichotomus]